MADGSPLITGRPGPAPCAQCVASTPGLRARRMLKQSHQTSELPTTEAPSERESRLSGSPPTGPGDGPSARPQRVLSDVLGMCSGHRQSLLATPFLPPGSTAQPARPGNRGAPDHQVDRPHPAGPVGSSAVRPWAGSPGAHTLLAPSTWALPHRPLPRLLQQRSAPASGPLHRPSAPPSCA